MAGEGYVCECVSCSIMSNSGNPMDCRPSNSPVHVILQARILECVAIPFSRGSSRPRDQTLVFCIADRFFALWLLPILWVEVNSIN